LEKEKNQAVQDLEAKLKSTQTKIAGEKDSLDGQVRIQIYGFPYYVIFRHMERRRGKSLHPAT